MAEAANILVVSDLHLGEDVKPTTHVGYLRHVVLIERELESFLAHYAANRIDGKPWRLIVNGDMVDFLAVALLPGDTVTRAGRFGGVAKAAMGSDVGTTTLQLAVKRATEQTGRVRKLESVEIMGGPAQADDGDDDAAGGVAAGIDAEDAAEMLDLATYGVGSDAEGARAKMIAVGKRHPGVFERLAGFLAAGNELIVIMGNHDVEFHWPEVQQTFRDIVMSHAEPDARDAITARMSFSPWFYYEEDLVWIEHGHQYDEYCSFDYWLNPVAPPKKPTRRPGIVMSLGGAGMRYFGNLMPDMNPYNQEEWSGLDYIRWGVKKGVRGLLRVIWLYFYLFYQLARGTRYLTDTTIAKARKIVHLRRLGELATKAKLSEKTLVAIDDMRRKPVVMNLLKVMQTLMIDRFVIGAVTLIAEILVFVLVPWPLSAALAGGLILLAALVSWLSGRSRHVDATGRLRAMSQMIRKHVPTKFVIMGHTHEPMAVALPGDGWYFNTGTWVATERPGLLRSFTHVLIRRDADGPTAELRRWSSADSESQPFDPSRPRVDPAGGVLIADSTGRGTKDVVS